MLGILLSILKILGIILLAVLGVVILVLLVLLLVPVRYRISGKWNAEEKRIEGKATWLFRLVHVSVSADKDGQHIVPKIMGIDLKKRSERKEKREKHKKKEKKNKRKKEKRKMEKRKMEKMEKETEKKKPIISEKKETEIKKTEIKEAEIKKTEMNVEEEKTNDFPEKIDNIEPIQKKSIFQKIYEKIINVLSAVSKVAKAWRGLFENAQELQKKKDKIFDFFCEKEALEAKDKMFRILKKAFRHIRPQKLKTSIRFGLENPADTGQLYAVLCLLYGIYGKDTVLEPDFENKILEGEIQIKGRIRLLNLIYYVIYLYRIKKLKEFIELLKNL